MMNTVLKTLAGIILVFTCGALGYGTKLHLEGNSLQKYQSIITAKEAVCTFDVANIPVSCSQTKIIVKLIDYPDIKPIKLTIMDTHHELWMSLNTLNPEPTEIEWYVGASYSELKKFYAFVSIFTSTLFFGILCVIFLVHVVPYLIKRAWS